MEAQELEKLKKLFSEFVAATKNIHESKDLVCITQHTKRVDINLESDSVKKPTNSDMMIAEIPIGSEIKKLGLVMSDQNGLELNDVDPIMNQTRKGRSLNTVLNQNDPMKKPTHSDMMIDEISNVSAIEQLGLVMLDQNGLEPTDVDPTYAPTSNPVMGWKIPDESTFSETRLNQILNEEAASQKLFQVNSNHDDRIEQEKDNDSVISQDDFCQKRNRDNPNRGQQFLQENANQEKDDYDEEVFKSFVEDSDDFSGAEVSYEVRNELHSILDTLTEYKSDGINNRDIMEHDSITVESQNHLVIPEPSTKRLHGSCDNTKMFVSTSDQKGKKLCCPYCNKRYCKLSRHVESMHKDEPDVQKFAVMPKGSKERWRIQDAIKKIGSRKWNTDPSINNGELIVSRRPSPKLNKKAIDYLTCPHCNGSHTITNLRNHYANCTNRAFKGKRNLKVLSRAIEGRISSAASEQLRDVIPVMKEDSIVQLIRYDWVLIVYGNLLCMKYSFHFQQNMIRAKLRLAGRVLHALRNINPEVTDFASLYHPKRYKSVIEAIKFVGRFDPYTNEFGTPATASSAITSIKQIGSILKCEYIEREDSDQVKRTENFLYLMDSQFSSVISKRVKESQQKKRRQKDHKIPSKDDVRLLARFLKRGREMYFKEVSENLSDENWIKFWIKLSEFTLVSVMAFSRRRAGESQNILVSDFNTRQSVHDTSNAELYKNLSEESKEVAKRFNLMKVRGKKSSNVNVLLSADVTKCIELLLRYRIKADIPSENPCLFAMPSVPGDKRIRTVNPWKAIKDFSKECGAKDPSSLRGTNLRKHFASSCMAMELSDDMVSQVAKHMGHAEKVHREYYRHNTIDREIVKIAKLLEATQGIEEDDSDTDDSDNDDDDSYIDDVIGSKSAVQAGPSKRKKIDKKDTMKSTLGASAGRKRKKVNEKDQPPKKKLCSTSVSGKKSTLRAGQKRTKTNEKKHPQKKLSVTSAKSALPASRKHKKINGKDQHSNNPSDISVGGTKYGRKRTTEK